MYGALLYFVRIRLHGVWEAIQLRPKTLGQNQTFLNNCNNNIWFGNSTQYVSFKTILRPHLLKQTNFQTIWIQQTKQRSNIYYKTNHIITKTIKQTQNSVKPWNTYVSQILNISNSNYRTIKSYLSERVRPFHKEITISDQPGNFDCLLTHVVIPFTAALLCKLSRTLHDKKWRTKYKFLTPYIPIVWVRLFLFQRDDSMDESTWTVNHRYLSLWWLRAAQFLLSAVNHHYLIHCVRIQHSYVTIII